jgi:hypothetical protein
MGRNAKWSTVSQMDVDTLTFNGLELNAVKPSKSFRQLELRSDVEG